MKAVKTIAALCFLTGIAIALVQPVLGAGDETEPPVKRKAVEPTDAGEPEPDEQETVELTSRYPKRCLRRVQGTASGLVAARRGSIAEIGFPDAAPVARVDVTGDVAWSPSGRFLAERGGRVFDQSGNPQGALFFEPREWEWSPVADCALATTGRGWLTFSIPDTTRKGIRLLGAPVVDFETSPNGRRLAAVVDGRGLWIADLRRGRIVQATEGRASIAGWFSNRAVLYSKTKGEGKLRYANVRGKTRVVRGASAGGTLVRCERRTLVAGRKPGLAELTSRRGRIRRTVLTRAGRYSSATCSPDGSFVAASAIRRGGKGPLVLLTDNGEPTTHLAPGRTANPQWTSEGLIYVSFDRGGRGRLWLIRPNAGLTPTAYRVGAPTQYDWHAR